MQVKKWGTGLLVLSVFFLLVYYFAGSQIKWWLKNKMQSTSTNEPVMAMIDAAKTNATDVKGSFKQLTIKLVKGESVSSLQLKNLGTSKLMINLQTWPGIAINSASTTVLEMINNGAFDEQIKTLCKQVTGLPIPVYCRIDPEMEVPVFEYPWQYQSGNSYINAFRHLAGLCKKYAPQMLLVWSPAGYLGTEEYWPGASYVDYISITINSKNELSAKSYVPYASIEAMLQRKIHRLRFFEKPIFILAADTMTENNFNLQWVKNVLQKIEREKDLIYHAVDATITNPDTISRNKNLVIGVFDPQLKLVNEKAVKVEHLFPHLAQIKTGEFKKQFDDVVNRGHDVIVTLELWHDVHQDKDPDLLHHLLNGKYDAVLKTVYQIISTVPQTVYLRWGHEMEIPVDRYPWQNQDPVLYIKAFRYVANFMRSGATNIRIVWGPAGDRGSMEWWPGDDVVDFISIAIYGLPDKNINDYNKQLSFTSIFQSKFHRMRFIHKPIFITEFGVKGPEAYKRKCLEDAAVTINKYPEILGVSYFNYADSPKAWGDAETPDWAISAATFKIFTHLLKDLPQQ
jgi:beta-mannanase